MLGQALPEEGGAALGGVAEVGGVVAEAGKGGLSDAADGQGAGAREEVGQHVAQEELAGGALGRRRRAVGQRAVRPGRVPGHGIPEGHVGAVAERLPDDGGGELAVERVVVTRAAPVAIGRAGPGQGARAGELLLVAESDAGEAGAVVAGRLAAEQVAGALEAAQVERQILPPAARAVRVVERRVAVGELVDDARRRGCPEQVE